jgi:hypothetical protein
MGGIDAEYRSKDFNNEEDDVACCNSKMKDIRSNLKKHTARELWVLPWPDFCVGLSFIDRF